MGHVFDSRMKYKLQKYAEIDLDALFENFYDTMLSTPDFSGFFKDQAQIRSLIKRQKQFLLDTIPLTDEEIKKRYITLGEYHDQIKVPFVDYLAGLRILEQGLIQALLVRNEPLEILEITFHFFKLIRSATAKGYLNKLLESDIEDINHYLAHVQRTSEIDTILATDRVIWLKNVIIAIKYEDRAAAPAPQIPQDIIDTIMTSVKGDAALARYAIEMADRMEMTARNIFYFLDRGSYEEVLPLYRELMSIYKLTLMLTNLATLASSDKELVASTARLEGALDSMSDTVFISDSEGRLIHFNNTFVRFHQFNNKQECTQKLAEFPNFFDVYSSSGELLPFDQWMVPRALKGEADTNVELTLRRKDSGETRIWSYNYAPIRDRHGVIVGTVVTGRDITERKQAENQLRIAATAFESQQGMIVIDIDGNILQANHAFTSITGFSAEEAIGKNLHILSSDQYDKAFYTAMWDCINDTGGWEGKVWNQRKNGEIYPGHLTITEVKKENGNLTNYVVTLTDISVSMAAEQEIHQLAFYDHLTGLPNRRLLTDRLHQAFASSARSGADGALLYIDLDNFKTVNDTLGHSKGDLLLQEAATRLRCCIREEDTVARLGGDEFMVMLVGLSEQNIEAAAQAELVGNKILLALNEPYQLEAHRYHCSSSIGITLFNAHQMEADGLLQQADIAMYQAKKEGRNTLRFFDQKMQENIAARALLERDLRVAIAYQHFELYFQIQMDSTSRPSGVEALIRWNHPELGQVSPKQFIPLAEETGLILQIGNWVLDTACAHIKAWQQDASTRNLVLSVNVSAKQFYQADFISQVQATLSHYAINPKLLKLELTESLLLESIENTITTMSALKDLGIQFALDDFGTGYSSLQYLKRLPLDQLKIDRSFVDDIVSDLHDQSIVRTIIAMAQSLELEVIAEGVETEQQWRLLLNSGCTHFQGYLFGRPVPLEEFETLLKKV